MDFCGNSIANDDCADDVETFNWHMSVLHPVLCPRSLFSRSRDHHLSGPIRIETAEPGDVLAIDIHEAVPFPHRQWGFSLIAPGNNPLDQIDTRIAKSIWDFRGIKTSSRHIPGVEFAGKPHCGVLGTAPSFELMKEWSRRETGLNAREGAEGEDHFAQLAVEDGAFVGQDLPTDVMARILKEGVRTKPAREVSAGLDLHATLRLT